MIKKFILSASVAFAMTTACFGQTSTHTVSDQYITPANGSSARITGNDGRTIIGNQQPFSKPVYANSAYPVVPQEQAATSAVQVAPQPAANQAGCDNYRSGGCDSGCDGGCQGSAGGCDSRNVGRNYFQGACGNACGGSCDDCCRYVKVFGGWNGLQDMVYLGANGPFRTSYSAGWLAGTAFGKKTGCDRSEELEFAYRNNSADEFMVGPAGAPTTVRPMTGSLQAYSGMKNYFRHFGCVGGWRPYIGAGAGVANINGDVSWGTTTLSIDDWVFAYQGMAGVERQVSNCVSAFVEYRYFATSDVEADLTTAVAAGGTFEDEYLAESIVFGFTIKR